MTNVNTEGLPPEMQQRIAEIIEKAKANAIQPVTQQAPVAPPAAPLPSLSIRRNSPSQPAASRASPALACRTSRRSER